MEKLINIICIILCQNNIVLVNRIYLYFLYAGEISEYKEYLHKPIIIYIQHKYTEFSFLLI